METNDLRQRLIGAGEALAPFVDELLALAAPSVRLRPRATTRTTAATPEGWATPSVVPKLDAGAVGVAGSFHNLALLADGTVMAWGENAHGQVGDATRADRPRPVPVPGCRGVISIAVGTAHSVALTIEGVVLAWGRKRPAAAGRRHHKRPRPARGHRRAHVRSASDHSRRRFDAGGVRRHRIRPPMRSMRDLAV